MEIKLGDVVRLKKKHPCGSYEWQVIRIGADIGIKCLKCQHHVLLKRSVFERRVKALISREGEKNHDSVDRIKELEAKLADIKERWPPHSVPVSMWQELEELEDELDNLKKKSQDMK